MNGFYIEERAPKSLPETFQSARARVAQFGEITPPLTFRELRNIYRAARVDAPIFLRCVAHECEAITT